MKKILIVDDEKAVFVLLRRVIEGRFGFEAIWAENGLKAIEAMEKNTFEAIILDINMPVMGGIETIKVIRRNEELSELPILMCSSASDKESISELIPFRITDYILKPIVLQEVIKKINKVFPTLD